MKLNQRNLFNHGALARGTESTPNTPFFREPSGELDSSP